MTRIRYTKNSDNGMLHSKPLLAGKEMVVVTLNPKEYSYTLTSFDRGFVIETGKAKTLHVLKIVVKRTLQKMGVNFDDEVRRRMSNNPPKLTPRQLANRKILAALADYLEKYPDARFNQALVNMGIVFPECDQYYEESLATWETVQKTALGQGRKI